ncbi:plasmid mobilization protein [Niabella hirudinis]|uniref:plasmid mobilization protein n=1 Tax=Niabella hirudinis TaxID=1285929 RepID=UPI003EBA1A77
MEPMKQNTLQNKGGRPKKTVKKSQLITLKCTSYEKVLIRAKAKKAGLSTSEYLLQLGLTGKIDSTMKTLPKEVLHVTGTLNHMAANLNQLAKKHNSVTDILTPLDRASLQLLSGELKGIAVTMKNYFQ